MTMQSVPMTPGVIRIQLLRPSGKSFRIDTPVDRYAVPEVCRKCGGLLNFEDVAPDLPAWTVELIGCTCS